MVRIDADRCKTGGKQLSCSDLSLDDLAPVFIRLAPDRTTLNTTAIQRRTPGIGEMITP